MPRAGATTAHLVLLDPGGGAGRRVALDRVSTRLGRASSNDVRLPDPDVSRHHAELLQDAGTVFVTDLGSTHGTFVNEVPVTDRHPLHDGDVIRVAGLRLRFVDPRHAGPAEQETTTGTRFDVEEQRADVIDNVQRDQYNQQVYNQHVLQVQQARDGFLQQVASTRTKARVLVWLGLLLQVAGTALFAEFVLRWMSVIFGALGRGTAPQPGELEPTYWLGAPTFAWGFSVAAVGGVLMVVGIVLHVTATARARRVDRELPLPPPPWPGGRNGPPRARRATDRRTDRQET